MSRALHLFALVTLAVGPLVACAANTDPAADPPVNSAAGEDQEVKAAKVITEADAGKTVQVPLGQAFSIKLASNPTTGYHWSVTMVDKTIGYGKESFISGGASAPVGSGGTQVFTWSTKSPLDVSGKHTIRFEYQRPWAETTPAAKTFEVTVDVGTSGCGTGPACATGSWCSACWGSMACIPKGAMC